MSLKDIPAVVSFLRLVQNMPAIVTAVPPLLSFPVAQFIPGSQLCMLFPIMPGRLSRGGQDDRKRTPSRI